MNKVTRNCLWAFVTFLVAFNSLNHIIPGASAEDAADSEQPTNADDMDTVPTDSAAETGLQPAVDADVSFVYTRPIVGKPYEFFIGKDVHFLIGFKNKAQKDFIMGAITASFHYAQDYKYVLQNFTSYPQVTVEPNQETTIGYTFGISEQYAATSYGFSVNLLYSDKDGVQYQNTVFNETVALIEIEDGLNGEVLFLYVLLAAFVGLIGYGLNKLYIKYVNPTRRASIKPEVEQEKVVTSEVDYDWLPPSMVANLKKTVTSTKKSAPAN